MSTLRGGDPELPVPLVLKNTFLHYPAPIRSGCSTDGSSDGCKGEDHRNTCSDSEASSRTSMSSGSWGKKNQSGNSSGSSAQLGKVIFASALRVADAADQRGRCEVDVQNTSQSQTGYAARTECALGATLDPSQKQVKKARRPGKGRREHLKRLAAEASQASSEAAQESTTRILGTQRTLSSKVYLTKLIGATLQSSTTQDAADNAPKDEDFVSVPERPGLLSL